MRNTILNRRFAAAKHKTIVVGLGNELFSDDAVGLLAVRQMAEAAPEKADFVETGLHGVALLDLFIGYEKAIIVDAIKTGRYPPGTIVEIDPEELVAVDNPSPHYTGVPELIKLAAELKINFPDCKNGLSNLFNNNSKEDPFKLYTILIILSVGKQCPKLKF